MNNSVTAMKEETLKRQDIFKGRIFTVHVDDIRLPDGGESKREVVDHNGGVCVAAFDEENRIYMVRQFRYPYKQLLLELPAGKLEIGEDPFEAMKREQREETGTLGTNYHYLGDIYPTPGYCGEILHVWACRISSYCEQDLDEDEFLEIEKIHIDRAVEMVMNNEIPDAKTQLGILKAADLLKRGLL